MAFNLLVVLNSPLDWNEINAQFHRNSPMFEVFPVIDSTVGHALGLSIPFKHFKQSVWESAAEFLSCLAKNYEIVVYDMYQGVAVDLATYVPDDLDHG